jgi:hypothetical protein
MAARKFLWFVLGSVGIGLVLMLIERWYELTFGIPSHTAAWWVATVFDLVPFVAGILVSSNVHQPSEAGYWIGFVLQWTAVGSLAYFFSLWRKRRRHSPR